MTLSDRLLPDKDESHQLYNLASAVCVGGTARAVSEGLVITTPSQHGAFAVHVPLVRPAEKATAQKYCVRLRILVSQGAIGVGILDRDMTAFHQELLLGAAHAWYQVEVTTPLIDDAGPLIVRNASRAGSSAADCEIAGIFPIVGYDPSSTRPDANAGLANIDGAFSAGDAQRLGGCPTGRNLPSHGNSLSEGLGSILFLHIPKTGGTTVWNTLSASLGISVNITEPRSLRQLLELPETTISQCRLLFGHMPYGLHRFLRQECRYVVFLREPVDRVASAYYYTKRTPTHPLYEKIRDGMTFVQFVRAAERDNTQTRQLGRDEVLNIQDPGSNSWGNGAAPLKKEDLDRAKERLRKLYFVGFREELDDDLRELHRRLGLAVPTAIPRYLEGNDRPAIDDIDPEATAVIREYNAFDVELYEYARTLRAGRTCVDQSASRAAGS